MPFGRIDVGSDKISCAHTALRRAARRLTQFYDDALAPTGFTSAQAVLVGVIDELGGKPGQDGVPLQHLARRLDVQVSAMTHALRPLNRDGLVDIHQDKKDRRVRCVTLTKKGAERTQQMLVLWKRVSEQTEAALGNGVTDQIREISDRIACADFTSALEVLSAAENQTG